MKGEQVQKHIINQYMFPKINVSPPRLKVYMTHNRTRRLKMRVQEYFNSIYILTKLFVRLKTTVRHSGRPRRLSCRDTRLLCHLSLRLITLIQMTGVHHEWCTFEKYVNWNGGSSSLHQNKVWHQTLLILVCTYSL